MTHNELSRQLEGLWHDSFKAPGYMMLRAVVELHKPKDFAIDTDFPWVGCKECERLYPCLTIQAIEKELG
jgi:hypothetical protein